MITRKFNVRVPINSTGMSDVFMDNSIPVGADIEDNLEKSQMLQ